MLIKNIMDTNFQDYKVCSMLICTAYCNFKCEQCHNKPLINQPNINMDNNKIVSRYLANNLTNAIIIGGLEPFEQFDELEDLIAIFRKSTKDPIVIYTGFYKEEVEEKIKVLQKYPNIIVKFGRYKPNDIKIFDKILGIDLASSNQYTIEISI